MVVLLLQIAVVHCLDDKIALKFPSPPPVCSVICHKAFRTLLSHSVAWQFTSTTHGCDVTHFIHNHVIVDREKILLTIDHCTLLATFMKKDICVDKVRFQS